MENQQKYQQNPSIDERAKWKEALNNILDEIRESPKKNRARSLVDTKICEAIMWLDSDRNYV